MISPAYLHKFLACNFETGELFRRTRHNRKCFASKNKDGYLNGTIQGKRFTAHRVIWAMRHGSWPDQIDHINGVRTDNRIENLRNVTSQGNAKNRKIQNNSTSGTHGLHWHKRDKTWNVRITVNRINKYVGSFKSKDEATAARKTAEVNYGFHPNHGRPRQI